MIQRKDPFWVNDPPYSSHEVVICFGRTGVADCHDLQTALNLCALLNSAYWMGKKTSPPKEKHDGN